MRQVCLHPEGKTRLPPGEYSQKQCLDDIHPHQRHHATDDKGLLAGIAEGVQGRVKRRLGACDITLCEPCDRRDHQTRTK
jgi:hypothetical protein